MNDIPQSNILLDIAAKAGEAIEIAADQKAIGAVVGRLVQPIIDCEHVRPKPADSRPPEVT